MGFRRFVIVVLIAAILGTGITHPPEAHAVSTAVIVVSAVVGWFAAVILVTWLIRRSGNTSFAQSSASPLLSEERLDDRYALHPVEPRRVRYGFDCGASADGPSLVCW